MSKTTERKDFESIPSIKKNYFFKQIKSVQQDTLKNDFKYLSNDRIFEKAFVCFEEKDH